MDTESAHPGGPYPGAPRAATVSQMVAGVAGALDAGWVTAGQYAQLNRAMTRYTARRLGGFLRSAARRLYRHLRTRPPATPVHPAPVECRCLCAVSHPGRGLRSEVCTGRADTLRRYSGGYGPLVRIPVCTACAEAAEAAGDTRDAGAPTPGWGLP